MSLGSPSLDAALDRYLTTPPEDYEQESNLKCCECGNDIYPGEEYYDFDGDIFCEDHAKEWLEEHKKYAEYEDCYGD